MRQMDTYVWKERTAGDTTASSTSRGRPPAWLRSGRRKAAWTTALRSTAPPASRYDLLRGNSPHTYSETGYGYAVEKAGSTGGGFTMFEGPGTTASQEMAAFAACVLNDTPLPVSGGSRACWIIFAPMPAALGKKIGPPYTRRPIRPAPD